MSIVTTDGIIAERYDHTMDNRDSGCTWLRMEGMHGDYIDVDPKEVMANMVENCYNEDVMFLFDRFTVYLNGLDDWEIESNKIDHILRFRDYLTRMVLESAANAASGRPINPDTGE